MSEPESKTDGNGKMNRIELMLKIIDRYGLATLMLGAMMWFNYSAIKYERETMMPALDLNTKSQTQVAEAMRQLPSVLRKELDSEPKTR